jgi:cystathionine beta-lyase/cystathionine gamma-synthase
MQQNATGAILDPQDSWLTIRGLKTLALRLERQKENALEIARWLSSHPGVRRVFYPGLSDHCGHELLKRQGTGFGAMISFEVADAAMVAPFVAGIGCVSFAESLGGVESLVTFPALQTHADISRGSATRCCAFRWEWRTPAISSRTSTTRCPPGRSGLVHPRDARRRTRVDGRTSTGAPHQARR